jgi:hypothetical protein
MKKTKNIWLKVLKALGLYSVRRMYVITQMDNGVKYYYKGQNSQWTPMLEGAKHYKKKPDFYWISDLWHKVEEYYA